MVSLPRNLTDAQERLLRWLCLRPNGEAPREHLDGRVVRALERRRLVSRVRDSVVVNGAGRAYHDAYLNHAPPPPQRGRKRQDPKAASLVALTTLAEHLPANAEVDLSRRGDGTGILAYAEDVVRALRRYVEQNL